MFIAQYIFFVQGYVFIYGNKKYIIVIVCSINLYFHKSWINQFIVVEHKKVQQKCSSYRVKYPLPTKMFLKIVRKSTCKSKKSIVNKCGSKSLIGVEYIIYGAKLLLFSDMLLLPVGVYIFMTSLTISTNITRYIDCNRFSCYSRS